MFTAEAFVHLSAHTEIRIRERSRLFVFQVTGSCTTSPVAVCAEYSVRIMSSAVGVETEIAMIETKVFLVGLVAPVTVTAYVRDS